MAKYSKVLLSGSTRGRPIKVSATSSGGANTIHTTGISSSIIDEVWIYATNTSSTDVVLTVEFGGTTSPDDRIEITVPGDSGLLLVTPGLVLTGDGSSGSAIKAFAGTGNVINVVGYINRIS